MIRKPLTIADKIALAILIIIIIFILVFRREIFSFICYIDICNRYLEYQEEVFETGKYSVHERSNESIRDMYYTTELSVNKTKFFGTGDTSLTAILRNSEMKDSTKVIRKVYKENLPTAGELEATNAVIMYNKKSDNYEIIANPCYAHFYFEKKSTFWDLMFTFKEIRNIRIDGDNYEIDAKESDTKYYLYRGDSFIVKYGDVITTLRVGEVSEADINNALAEPENTILLDYEVPTRNFSENITTKLSNCDQEAGTIVAYDFKISNEEDQSLKYLSEVYNFDDISVDEVSKIERLRNIAVANNITYKKFQERWSGLRDLTDEDFINYTAIIVVDTDNTRELHYKEVGQIEEAWAKTDIYMTESEAKEDYKYSGCLVLVPNYMLYSGNGSNTARDYMVHIANN